MALRDRSARSPPREPHLHVKMWGEADACPVPGSTVEQECYQMAHVKLTAPAVGKSYMVAKIMIVEWMYIVDFNPLTGMYIDGESVAFSSSDMEVDSSWQSASYRERSGS